MKLNAYFTQYLLNCIMFSVMIPNMSIYCRILKHNFNISIFHIQFNVLLAVSM